jgi:homoserine dehydrogenase
LAQSILGIRCKLSDINVLGITNITSQMIDDAIKSNECYKLIATAQKKDNNYQLSVLPIKVSKDTFLGSCIGWECGIEIYRYITKFLI